jgi:hypothetical protein
MWWVTDTMITINEISQKHTRRRRRIAVNPILHVPENVAAAHTGCLVHAPWEIDLVHLTRVFAQFNSSSRWPVLPLIFSTNYYVECLCLCIIICPLRNDANTRYPISYGLSFVTHSLIWHVSVCAYRGLAVTRFFFKRPNIYVDSGFRWDVSI